MNIVFAPKAFKDYTDFQIEDKKITKKINELIRDIVRNGVDEGIGKPEPLKYGFSGTWSRHITKEHRLIYFVSGDFLNILSCRGHYEN